MADQPDVSAAIRVYLMSHAGQHCETCLLKGTKQNAKALKAAFRPSKDKSLQLYARPLERLRANSDLRGLCW